MGKSKKPIIARIIHFEDQPQHVRYPSLLDTGIGSDERFEDCSMDSSDDETRHVIDCAYQNRPLTLEYLIPEDLESVEKTDIVAAQLIVADLSFGVDARTRGYEIVKAVMEMGVGIKDIWMITGYHIQAVEIFGEESPRIIEKPPIHGDVRNEMLEIIYRHWGVS